MLKLCDKPRFTADLIKVNCDSFCNDPNPNAALEHFREVVIKLLDKYVPYKNISNTQSLNLKLSHRSHLD